MNATAFAVLFGVFMLQIFYRYVLNHPLSWTQEIAEILYVWIVCVGAATIVAEREHVTFSLVYVSVKPKLRRIFAIAGTGLVTLVMLVTLPGNLDYILFTFRQKTPTLRLPMSVVFSAFGVFMVLIIINGVIRLYRLSRSDWEKQP
ncbi:TRAP transporter small permease [Bauldia litoralis]|uniref:TRAP transporter small permease protein n=1 Tax=Bauldia litoralis TaxID=665467 RepID=A0A1G6DV66_9HYPH|nr:TRAP transporter small permease [Bauldia litoralis]SDB49074.1 TRAP-type C4-dicarboxylate transport system, small permease component [Bauldia litoralis]